MSEKSIRFSPKVEEEFEEIVSRYPRRDASLLPILWLAQREFKVLSPEVRRYVAERLGVSLARVESVVSFYTMYQTESQGRYHLQLCRNLSCALRGSESLMKCVEEELGVRPGETSKDGKFTYSLVECIAACGGAPALQIDSDYHENMTATSLRGLLKGLRDRG